MMHTTAFYQKRIGFIIAELFGLQFLAIFLSRGCDCLDRIFFIHIFGVCPAFLPVIYICLNLFISVGYRSISFNL